MRAARAGAKVAAVLQLAQKKGSLLLGRTP